MQPDSGRSESEHQSQNMTELSAGVWVEEVEATFKKNHKGFESEKVKKKYF